MAEDFFKKTGKFIKKGGQFLSDKLNLEIHDLINAVNKNDEELVARCVSAGLDPNLQDGINRRALPIAIDNNNTTIIKILLSGKAHPNLPGKDGESAIYKAVSWKNEEYVKLLLDAGADIYRKEPNGITPIEEAKRKGFVDLLNMMQNHKEEKKKEKVEEDKSKHEELKAKADQAQKDREEKANAEAKQNEFAKKQAAAVATNKIEKTYNTDNKGFTYSLIAAIQKGDDAGVDVFLEKIENVNEIDSELKTSPLLAAIAHKNTKAVVELVKKGANVGLLVPTQRHSPLTLAVSTNAHKLVEFILEKHTEEDTIILNNPDQILSPTFLAYKDPKMLNLLLAAGADPYFGGKEGMSPVVKAIEKGSVGILPVLAKHKIDLNKNTEGKTPIEWAIHFNRKDWVIGLLEEGVEAQAGLDFAKTLDGREDIVTILEEE